MSTFSGPYVLGNACQGTECTGKASGAASDTGYFAFTYLQWCLFHISFASFNILWRFHRFQLYDPSRLIAYFQAFWRASHSMVSMCLWGLFWNSS